MTFGMRDTLVAHDMPAPYPQIPVQRLVADGDKPIIVRPLSDLHIGSPFCDVQRLKRDIRAIQDNGEYWVGVGDYCQFDLKGQKHEGVYEQTLSPEEQLEAVEEIFTPIRDRCLGLIAGNHDMRPRRDTGVSSIKWLFRSMGLGDKFHHDNLIIRLEVGERRLNGRRAKRGGDSPCRYILYVRHGTGGGATKGSKINHIMRSTQQVIADLYVNGHGHDPIVTGGAWVTPSFHDKVAPTRRPYRVLMAPSYQRSGGYGAVAGFSNLDEGSMIALLHTDHEEVQITY